jgi:hypothetical protein
MAHRRMRKNKGLIIMVESSNSRIDRTTIWPMRRNSGGHFTHLVCDLMCSSFSSSMTDGLEGLDMPTIGTHSSVAFRLKSGS